LYNPRVHGDATLSLLLATAVSTALFHTLIPDHWLPFVLIGRARGWSKRTTLAVSAVSAAIHVALSAALALVAVAAGLEAARAAGQSLSDAAPFLLIGFGLLYAAWAWRKGGHFHPGGKLLHGAEEETPCRGEEGSDPEHLHYHADDALIRNTAGRSGLALAAIVGINPCVLMLPLVLQGADRGTYALAAILAAYAVTTVALMVGLSVAGVAGAMRFQLPGAARYMEAASGLLIAGAGITLLLLER
jgi:ABC-type nickel/cobalt efflux system permease component RcnA